LARYLDGVARVAGLYDIHLDTREPQPLQHGAEHLAASSEACGRVDDSEVRFSHISASAL
jgi:hypothetical protein